jgi:hypothetical protein
VVRTLVPVVFYVLVLRIIAAFLTGNTSAQELTFTWNSFAILSIAWIIGIMASWVSYRFPEVGTKPLVHTGGLIILLVVSMQFAFRTPTLQPRERTLLIRALQPLAHGENVDKQIEGSQRLMIARAVDDKIQRTIPSLAAIASEELKIANGQSREKPKEDRDLLSEAEGLKIVSDAALEQRSIWPVYLAGAAFIYVWWIAIITFDLTFVWHLYIMWGGANSYIDERLKQG